MERNIMMSERVKKNCLAKFAARYPAHDKAIFIERSDGRFRVLNQDADSILFDQKGRIDITDQYLGDSLINNATATSATFEVLE